MIEKLDAENLRLKNAILELSILNEIATQISSLKSVNEIISTIVDKCIKHLKVEQADVMLLEENPSKDPLHTMIRKIDMDISRIMPLRLNTQLVGWILKNNNPLIVNDLQNDERFKGCCEEISSIRSLLGVPLLSKSKTIGVLTVFNKKNNQSFNDDDKRLLSIISSQSAQIIENARLLEKEKELTAIREELRMAAEIQKKLLPNVIPSINGYDIWGLNIPAKEVSGDYFDFVKISPTIYSLCLGDITGKGLPAAMLMSNLQATFRGQIKVQQKISECIKVSNTLLYHSTDADKFATFFGAILSTNENTVTYCNAGHDNPVLIKKDKTIHRLNKGGLLLGFLEDYTYEEDIIELKSGETIIIYSDGITEAIDEYENEFGEENLIKLILENLDLSAQKMTDKIITSIKSYIGNQKQMDDMTLIVIKKE